MKHSGSCHSGSISYSFDGPEVTAGLRCNCSICRRKGALMTDFVIPKDQLELDIEGDSLGLYQFGNEVAKHHFCKKCGIYTFHETFRTPGHYRFNIGCLDGADAFSLPFDVFDGASL